MSKKIFFIAGERSGDLHGSNLIKSIKSLQPEFSLMGWGGDQMEAAGMTLQKHYRDIAFMGFWEVFKNLKKIKGFLKECKTQILNERPAAVILIDYGGFNMKIASFCKEHNIAVHYYISPKVWAWNTKRAYKIKKNVDYLYCILPFEPKFFNQFDYQTDYVGNPVVDAVENYQLAHKIHIKKDIVAVLPGSRKQEVVHMLNLMTDLVDEFSEYQFVVTAVDNLEDDLYDIARNKGIDVVYDKTYAVLNKAKAALVTSGTATLETALFGVPQVVCYKTSWLSYQIAKGFIKVPFISLVNLIANKEVITELIQQDYTIKNIVNELRLILSDGNKNAQIHSDYKEVKSILGPSGASLRTAKLILSRI